MSERKQDSLAQHQARCRICKHPEREEIEREFLDWASPREIAKTWKIASYRAVYRHAHAVGLFERRRGNWQVALERIIERVSEVDVTASAVVAAIRLCIQIERERSAAGRERPRPRFRLSFEGLPRTDAVDAGKSSVAQACPPRRASACVAHPGPSGQAKREDGSASANSAGTSPAATSAPAVGGRLGSAFENPGATTAPGAPGSEKSARTSRQQTPTEEASAPPETQRAPMEPDPRIVLGEQGRVAGLPWPWPKEKTVFARNARRWRKRDPWVPTLDTG